MNAYAYFSDEHLMFRDVVDRFVEAQCGREYIRRCDGAGEYPYEAYAQIVEQGWLGLTVPEAHGGIGADLLFRVILQEGLSRYAFDMGAVYGVTVWGIETLLRFGTPAQQAQYIGPALAGKIRFSISMSEPDAGSDLTSIGLKAADQGDHFLLNGQKLWASAAGARDNIIILAARTTRVEGDRRAGLTMFLVPNTAPGLELRRLKTLSRHMTGTYEGFYTDVRIPKENVVGEVDRGWDVLSGFLVEERIGGASMYVGNTQTALDDAIRYAKTRKQFGRHLADFQVIKHALSDAATELEAARLLTYQAAWLACQGTFDLKAAAMAKLYASEAGLRITTLGMQVLGGYAQLPEFDMERYWRDAKQSTVSSGTSQIQRSIIGTALEL